MTPGHAPERMPPWLRRPLATPGQAVAVEGLLGELRLNTVCRSAKCPNRGECYASGTATFLIAGDACTRGCRFCAVESREPAPLDSGEPARVAEAARRMELKHVVITMVTRDDVPDGAASHVAATVRAVREVLPPATVEVLTSDLGGALDSVDVVIDARPDVFNHNLETVPRLYAEVRPGAVYERSLAVLAHAAAASSRAEGATAPSHREGVSAHRPVSRTKSGLMLGLGERPDEVVEVMGDLRQAGVTMLTLGQYLRPSEAHLRVAEFVEPRVFADLARVARELGFDSVASAPFVRSSYHAAELAQVTEGAGAGGAGSYTLVE